MLFFSSNRIRENTEAFRYLFNYTYTSKSFCGFYPCGPPHLTMAKFFYTIALMIAAAMLAQACGDDPAVNCGLYASDCGDPIIDEDCPQTCGLC
jgi:hypothetical protein